MKKKLIQIGIYVGIFAVLNVGMFFLLKMTQPKSAVLDAALHGDSTAVHETDSTVVHEDKEFDDAPEIAEENSDATSDSAQHGGHDSNVNSETAQNADHVTDTHGTQGTADSHASLTENGEELLTAGDEVDSTQVSEQEALLEETPKSTAEISKLAKLLEGMKPGEAAVIAERLPTETIVQLVMRMKSRNGAKMMASLPVPVAASVATRMAELSGVKSPS